MVVEPIDFSRYFTPEERELIAPTDTTFLNPEERGRRFMLFIRPLRLPFQPGGGSEISTTALILARFGVKGAADELARALQRSVLGQVDFKAQGGRYSVARQAMELLLRVLREQELSNPYRNRVPPFADLLFRDFGGFSRADWLGVSVADTDLATAKFIELRVPEVYDEVPQRVRSLVHEFGRPTIVYQEAPENPPPPPPSPVIYPQGPSASEIGRAVSSAVREAIPIGQLGETVEQAVTRAIKSAGGPFIAPLPQERPAPAAAPTPTAPPSVPVPVPGPAPQPAPLPKTFGQVSLSGERVFAPGTAAPTLGTQLEDKYRPLFLADVIGNGENVGILKGAASTGNFAKAYIVEGRPGTGKTSAVLASIRDYLQAISDRVGQALYNPNYSPASPTFGIEPSVLLYRNALTLITRGGVTTLLGDLSRFTRTAGYPGVRRFIVVDDVTKFTKDQQEILLPLLERYGGTTVFLIANDPDYIDALRSRARTIRWTRPEPVEVETRLVEIIRNENFPFPNPVEEAHRIVQALGMQLEFRQALIRLASDAAAIGGAPGG